MKNFFQEDTKLTEESNVLSSRFPALVLSFTALTALLSAPARADVQFSLPNLGLPEGAVGQNVLVHCAHDRVIVAFSVGIQYDPVKLSITQVSLAGTSAANADFIDGRIVNGNLTYGVALDISPPLGKALPAAADDTLLRLTVDVLAPAPATAALNFVNGLSGGNVPINNIVTDVNGQSIFAVLVNGSINVFGGEVELLMTVPRVDSLTALLATPGGDVDVNIQPRYDAKGKFICGGACTVDGSPVAIKGTIKNRVYKLSLKGTEEKVKLQITGEVGSGKATCKYAGPKGKATLVDAPVSLVAEANGPTGTITLSPLVDAKGKVTGAGTISSGFGNDRGAPGVLKGKRKGDNLSFTLSSRPQKLTFKGARAGDGFTGILKVKVPPEKSVRTGYTVPNLFQLPPP